MSAFEALFAVAAVAAIVIVPLTWWGITKQRPPKRSISYRTTSDFPIIAAGKFAEHWGELSVQYGDSPLYNPRSVIVLISNSGRAEARASDFEEPLGVSVEAPSKVIAATARLIAEPGRPGDEIETELTDSGGVVIPSRLLNSGEVIEVRLLVSGRGTIHVSGRIAGFTFKEVVDPGPSHAVANILRWDLPVLVMAGLLFFAGSWVVHSTQFNDKMPNLHGLTAAAAAKKAKGSEFDIAATMAVPSNERKGVIVYQSVKPGSNLNTIARVIVGVSTGDHDVADSVMPSLYGMTEKQAKDVAASSYFYIGNVTTVPSSLPKWTVVYQSVLFGSPLKFAEPVDIGLSSGKGS